MAEPSRQRMAGMGIPLIVLVLTIIVGLISLTGFFSRIDTGQGLCLIAAALAFGLASNALWRR